MKKPSDSFSNIPQAFECIAADLPEQVVYSQATICKGNKQRVWQTRSYSQVKERVRKIALFLKDKGVRPGSKVAILSNSRPEWMEADIAALSCGAVVASIYQSLLPDDIAYILFDSGARVVFAENQEQVDKLFEVTQNKFLIPATEDRPECETLVKLDCIVSFESVEASPLVTELDDILNSYENPEALNTQTEPNELACLVYTSGTTGPPKGVMQTHLNHLSNIRQAFQSGIVADDSSIMLFLPLAHSFAKLMGYIGFLTPATLHFPAVSDTKSSKLNPLSISQDISQANSTIIPLVPRLLEKMKDGIVDKSSKPGLGAKMLKATLSSANKNYEAKLDRSKLSIFDKILYSGTSGIREKIKAKLFGSNFQYAISGGAKLPVAVAEFFDALGILILEGYGLTETCVATNINLPQNRKIGSVGPALTPDIELKITSEGEICFRGPNITLGYHQRPTATNQSWDKDGWFHTGDLGAIDQDGFLSIVGRKKEIIVTSGGKNIAPNDIEEQIKKCPLVSQAVMIGDGRPYCVALVTLNQEATATWAKENKIPLEQDFSTAPEVKDFIWQHVKKENEALASFESVKKIYVLGEDFTVENGFLTPTFKVKRKLVEERYSDEIEGLY